jgi:predicted lipid-binding transport protein (Tim44 family)
LLSVVLVLSLALGGGTVSAKRLGSGVSVGKQSDNVTHTKPGSAATPAPGAAAPAQATPGVNAPPASKPWTGLLGGLAAGLGLAWLASSLGLGGALGPLLLLGLLGLGLVAAIGWATQHRKRHPDSPHAALGGLAYQSASGRGGAPRDYSPQNVGNDASARPWERNTIGFDVGRSSDATAGHAGGLTGSGLVGSPAWGIPAGFDVEAFLQASKANFIGLQAAWDRSDIPSLRAMMTDDMLAQIKVQLSERERHSGSVTNVTEVVMIEARLLGIEELETAHMASVEFSGMIREDVSAGPNPFREVWNITRPKSGAGGWLVAGVQALQ